MGVLLSIGLAFIGVHHAAQGEWTFGFIFVGLACLVINEALD